MAERTGVSERTLRYYESLGLLHPAGHSPGGTRRYAPGDVARVGRIRSLQSLMGFNLEEIAGVIAAEDRLAGLQEVYRAGGPVSKDALLAEAVDALESLRSQVLAKLGRLAGFRDELDATITRYRGLLEDRAQPATGPRRASGARRGAPSGQPSRAHTSATAKATTA